MINDRASLMSVLSSLPAKRPDPPQKHPRGNPNVDADALRMSIDRLEAVLGG
jgi:hypothetical protein